MRLGHDKEWGDRVGDGHRGYGFGLFVTQLITVLVLGQISGGAFAQTEGGFSWLLQRARTSEPTYLGAQTNVDSAKAKKAQALGALLPQVTASANSTANNRSYETRNSLIPPQKDAYNSKSAQINLTQPIWRYANVVAWWQSEAVQAQAEHQLVGAEQDLMAKLVATWLDVLAARDTLAFNVQQVEATRKQWEILLRGAELGANAGPQVDEARAKFDQATADAITAQTDLNLKVAVLEQLVGPLGHLNIPFMRGGSILAGLGSEKLNWWLEQVESRNPAVNAATQAYEAASAEVRKQSAGHYPTVDMVASYGRNGQAVGGFPGQAGYDITQGSVGVQLNIPIYSGGTQSAKVDEAIAQKEKARLDIEAARRAAMLAAKQAWFGWQAGNARAIAGLQSLQSGHSALALAQKGRDNGIKTDLDVFQAEQQLLAAQRDYRKGCYDQVAAHVKLKAAAGALTEVDVFALDGLFVTEPEDFDLQRELSALRGSAQ